MDYGSARVGLARGSSSARLAEPLTTVAEKESIREIIKLAADNHAAGVIVGLPRGLDGNETEQTKLVRNWVQTAKAQMDLPFYWQDEALTSRQVAGKLQKSNSKHQSFDEHAQAAAAILQDFLDTPEEERVRC